MDKQSILFIILYFVYTLMLNKTLL